MDLFIDSLTSRYAGRQLSLVFPEGEDERILRAACKLAEKRIARITVLGKAEAIVQTAQAAGLDLHSLNVLQPTNEDQLAEYAILYRQGRASSSEAVARRLVQKPLFYAGMMVKSGAADAFVAGVTCPTARVVEAGMMTVGLSPGISTPSSFFVMLLPQRPMIFADCALNVDPSAEQLADIAIASAHSYSRLFKDSPRVALLSFSTRGSARHALVDKVQQAVEMAQSRAPDLLIDGEMQLDTALDPDIAGRKMGAASAVAGQANVLIFPDLNSANIAYKLARYLSGAAAIGPVLQGFQNSLGDLSRGASVDEIIATAKVVLSQVE
jgi:phosphate acetyltransferase